MKRLPEERVAEVLGSVASGAVTEGNVDLLLEAFQSGFSLGALAQLLGSERDDVVEAAVWIASELGSGAAMIVQEVASLLRHSSGQVRFHALDVILAAAEPSDVGALAAAVRTVDDAEEAVRWKAMNFLARATTEQLRSAQRGLGGSDLAGHVSWLLQAYEAGRIADLRVQLDDVSNVRQRFAAAAAARLVASDPAPLREVALDSTPEIAKFAQQHLRYASIARRP